MAKTYLPAPVQSMAIHWLGTSQANVHVVPSGEHHSTTLDSPIIVPWRIWVLDNLLKSKRTLVRCGQYIFPT